MACLHEMLALSPAIISINLNEYFPLKIAYIKELIDLLLKPT
jgi:hypothetical protein